MLFRLNKVIETLEDVRDQLLAGAESKPFSMERLEKQELPGDSMRSSIDAYQMIEAQSKFLDEQSKQIAKLQERAKKQKKMLKQVLALLEVNHES